MQTQTVFKAGNSDVVAIPKSLGKDTGITSGKKVVVKQEGERIRILREERERVLREEKKIWLNT